MMNVVAFLSVLAALVATIVLLVSTIRNGRKLRTALDGLRDSQERTSRLLEYFQQQDEQQRAELFAAVEEAEKSLFLLPNENTHDDA